MKSERHVKPEAPYSYDGLERVIHEKARLGILTSLLTHPEGLVFSELKDLCALTDGNLSRHIQALAEAELVSIWKGFEKNRPKTLCKLTPKGRERFMAYIDELQRVVTDAAKAESADETSKAIAKGGFNPNLAHS